MNDTVKEWVRKKCLEYDAFFGSYPEHEYEGLAVFRSMFAGDINDEDRKRKIDAIQRRCPACKHLIHHSESGEDHKCKIGGGLKTWQYGHCNGWQPQEKI